MSKPSKDPSTEEPDASIAHVRICGGPGSTNSRVYPSELRKSRQPLGLGARSFFGI